MTAGAPWSVKGIDPKAREVAKDLARRSGMTLGEWLNRVILEDDVPEEVVSEAQLVGSLRRRPEAPRLRLASAEPAPTNEMDRVAQALDRLAGRIEASETRTGLAIAGIEHSVRQAVARIEAAERENLAVVGRLDEVAERLEAEPPAGPRAPDVVRGVYGEATEGRAALAEEILEQLGERMASAEARTGEALERLGSALSDLDGRLLGVEQGASPGLDRRLEALAAELGERMEAVRADALEGIQASSAQGFEARLAEMAEHVRAAETRSARAVEKMGREVLHLAEALNKRLLTAEQQNAEAIEQVGGEIARIGGVVESRLTRAEHAQAEALEKLGAEIGRVTDRLTERVVHSERRAAQAIEDMGEQVARVTERMEHRHERLAGDLAERVRQTEARSEQLIEAARNELQASVAETLKRLAEAAPPQPAAPAESLAEVAPASTPVSEPEPPAHAFGPELFDRAEASFEDADELDLLPPRFRSSATEFAPIEEADEDLFLSEDEAPGQSETEALSTREVIEQARQAARAEQTGAAGPQISKPEPAGERRASARAGGRQVFRGFGFRTRARPPSAWQTALLLAGGAAFLSVGAAGVVLVEGPANKTAPQMASGADTAEVSRAAVALAPQAITAAKPQPETASPSAAPASEYAEAVRDVQGGQAGGLSRLKSLADGGYAPAQFFLAKLYETGGSGVLKNPAEARRWTQKAAEGGDPSAMHNLALYYFRGEAGPQNLAVAAQWFRKAAEGGVVDSQYNLGLLYLSGSGVSQDVAEAYKWFMIAAIGGDAQARANARELAPKIPPAVLASVNKAAASFHPTVQGAAEGQTSPGAVQAAQKILGKLGYYGGSADGTASPEMKLALLAYQRDHGLPVTGALDPSTASQLSVFAR